ncbi:MAG: hypothetical protein HZB67_01530, partial [Candidatus Aenigmarchaeota archaeon]|nr:hypothetical protein [Candidatus Aenigmarchaeota archaeon]
MKGLSRVAILFILLFVVLSISVSSLASNPVAPRTGVVVGNAPPFVEAKWELPDIDPVKNGTQVLPVQNGVRIVKKCVVVCDPNGVDDIISVAARTFSPNTSLFESESLHVANDTEFLECEVDKFDPEFFTKNICKLYTGIITMNFFDSPGNYTVLVSV